MASRFYRVEHGNEVFLVEAVTQAAASRHIAVKVLKVSIAKPEEIVKLMRQGVLPEAAASEPAAPEAEPQA